MVINVSVQYNGGFLPEIILLALCEHWGTLLISSSSSTKQIIFFFVIPFVQDVRLHLSVNMRTHQPESHRRKGTFFLRCLP